MSFYTLKIPGRGRPLLFLHGWGHSHTALKPLAELLSSVCQPHLIDLPGFGNSKMPDDVWGTYDYADRIVRYLDENKIDKVSLLGHSFGGKIAMCLAIKYPERVSNLVVIAASGLKPKRSFFTKIRFKTISFLGRSLKVIDQLFGTDLFKTEFVNRYASQDYKNAGSMRNILVRTVIDDLAKAPKKIKAKTLILWGENDQDTPLDIAVQLSKMIDRSRLVSFPQHGHQIVNDVGTHLLATYIIPFLKEA